MLRVIVEIHPYGDSSAKRQIAQLDIGNMSELSPHSDYVVEADLEGRKMNALVKDHRRASGWMPLVEKALAELERRK